MLSIEVLGDVLTSNEREDELEKVLKMFPNDRGYVFLFSFIFSISLVLFIVMRILILITF